MKVLMTSLVLLTSLSSFAADATRTERMLACNSIRGRGMILEQDIKSCVSRGDFSVRNFRSNNKRITVSFQRVISPEAGEPIGITTVCEVRYRGGATRENVTSVSCYDH